MGANSWFPKAEEGTNHSIREASSQAAGCSCYMTLRLHHKHMNSVCVIPLTARGRRLKFALQVLLLQPFKWTVNDLNVTVGSTWNPVDMTTLRSVGEAHCHEGGRKRHSSEMGGLQFWCLC